MEKFYELFIFIGPLLMIPLGWLLTFWLSMNVNAGWKRWCLVIFGPVLILVATMFVYKYVALVINPPEQGGALLSVAVFGVSFCGLFLYYPILIVLAVVRFLKKRNNSHKEVYDDSKI